ncbi:MAG: CBS domain-containing protein [Desulfomonilia bacterium]|nr:CBS domain-containing protein [Desulfomonilia bacterium]
MFVREIMTPSPDMIPGDDYVLNAARRMGALNVGILPVMQDGKLVGMVTDRDIVTRGVAESRDPVNTRVKDIMSGEVLACSENTDVSEAARLMEENKVRRLIVIDKNNQAVGIVSLGDLATSREKDLAG